MKKILLLFLLIATHNTVFSQEENKQIDTSYHRFGMNILSLGGGFGVNGSGFPLSFYLANDLQQIISFGLDWGITPFDFGIQLGMHVGFGKMKATSYNPRLNLGYLIEFSAGYSTESLLIPYTYIGFSPNFILEIDQFIFKAGLYIDTSLIVTANVGIGFLLK
ncbi:MAG: hypothetical protein KFW21_05155 [Spirochaetota bacterium]|nr:hypothetical protein [Spirochaetota bacterium]